MSFHLPNVTPPRVALHSAAVSGPDCASLEYAQASGVALKRALMPSLRQPVEVVMSLRPSRAATLSEPQRVSRWPQVLTLSQIRDVTPLRREAMSCHFPDVTPRPVSAQSTAASCPGYVSLERRQSS